ncbi:MAG: hypothetical protein M1837_006389 [Sclerophora amabilis]|nr:MAG: hypothetical protein M1837_006389 [Sclerophora amabilis]
MLPNKPPRQRRKSTPGKEKVKHRRTRSGCFTCRARRVKCDEKRPSCERCEKGDRECIYPDASGPGKNPEDAGSKQGQNAGSLRASSCSGEELDEDDNELRKTTVEEAAWVEREEHPPSGALKQEDSGGPAYQKSSASNEKRPSPTLSDPPPLVNDKSPTPSTEGSSTWPASRSGSSTSQTIQTQPTNSSSPPRDGSDGKVDYSHLSSDVRFYLNYHQTHLTSLHYFFRHDSTRFLRTSFLEIAVSNEPLLYAVVGFSAYHQTLRRPDGRIQHFLGYYNKSVSLLRQSLAKGRRHTLATLLTILQLATIEEYLGDWVNLLSHQKAAYEILLELYNPKTIRTRTDIITLTWYTRFDVYAGLMGGWETVLRREWFEELEQLHLRQIQLHPNDVIHKIERAIVSSRLLAMDMSSLFAKYSKGNLPHDKFVLENEKLAGQFAAWNDNLDPSLADPARSITSFEGARDLDSDDIVDPYLPGTLFEGPLWTMNFLRVDWRATMIMHRYQTALALRTQPGAELGMLALEICQMLEAIELWPRSPPGSILAMQSSFGIASLFLPKDSRHTMWCRRKFARIENLGYIYPPTLRGKMAALWGIPEVQHWWLPNNECYPPIIRSIRAFVEERTRQPRDETSSDLKDIKTIFGSMKITDDSPLPSPLVDDGQKAMVDTGEPHDALMVSAASPEFWDMAAPGEDQKRYAQWN